MVLAGDGRDRDARGVRVSRSTIDFQVEAPEKPKQGEKTGLAFLVRRLIYTRAMHASVGCMRTATDMCGRRDHHDVFCMTIVR